MKIAVTYENGLVFQHFGRTEQFKIYDTADMNGACVVSTNGTGHSALAGFLQERGVQALICGGISGGAMAALHAAGIKVYGGVSGSADEAAAQLAAGTLVYDPTTARTGAAARTKAAVRTAAHTPTERRRPI